MHMQLPSLGRKRAYCTIHHLACINYSQQLDIRIYHNKLAYAERGVLAHNQIRPHHHFQTQTTSLAKFSLDLIKIKKKKACKFIVWLRQFCFTSSDMMEWIVVYAEECHWTKGGRNNNNNNNNTNNNIFHAVSRSRTSNVK